MPDKIVVRLLKKAVPHSVKAFLTYHRFLPFELERKFVCPVCEGKVRGFKTLDDYFFKELDQYGYQHSIFTGETFNLLNYSCPKCGAADRERLYALYLDRWLQSNEQKERSLLDIAPNQQLQKKIRKIKSISYRSCDLLMQSADDVVDIQNMTVYESNRFDIIICSHVLEHVPDDRKAMSELYRVLKPGGWGIIMAPINLSLVHTFEDPTVQTEGDRWKYYGQGDHLRLYSKQDFVKNLEGVGFKVDQLGVEYFGESAMQKAGISTRSVLYIANK